MLADEPTGRAFLELLQSRFLDDDPTAEGKALEQANLRVLADQYAAIARGDFNAIEAMVSDDFVFEMMTEAPIPFPHVVRGRGGLGEQLRKSFEEVEQQIPEVQTIVAQGNLLAVFGFERGRVRTSGELYALHWVQLFTFRDGKIVSIRQFFDSAGLPGSVRPFPA
jgi:ketosteroid isomerase-like protein